MNWKERLEAEATELIAGKPGQRYVTIETATLAADEAFGAVADALEAAMIDMANKAAKLEGEAARVELLARRFGIAEVTTGVARETVMTYGERMVWAAAYANAYQRNMLSVHHVASDKANALAESAAVCNAIEHAGHAVVYMREKVEAFAEGWGEDSELGIMLREMLGR